MKRLILISVLLLSLVDNLGSARSQDSNEHAVITPENAGEVEQLAILGFGKIEDVAWSPNGEKVAVASSTGILLYDSGHFDTVSYERLTVPEVITYSVAYSPDGHWLASSSGPYPYYSAATRQGPVVVRLWDTTTNTIVAEWKTDSEWEFSNLEFSPDGHQLILYLGYSSAAIMWDVSDVAWQPRS